jgi:hypothetical protein
MSGHVYIYISQRMSSHVYIYISQRMRGHVYIYISQRMSGHVYIYIRGINFASVSMIFQWDFGTVSTVWYLLFIIYPNLLFHLLEDFF